MIKNIVGKVVDDIFEDIGFVKHQDDEYVVEYLRYDEIHKFNHCLMLAHKKSGRHIVQSYDPDLMDEKNIGNTCVGLTPYEMKLCVLKMWAKGWNTKKVMK